MSGDVETFGDGVSEGPHSSFSDCGLCRLKEYCPFYDKIIGFLQGVFVDFFVSIVGILGRYSLFVLPYWYFLYFAFSCSVENKGFYRTASSD